MPVISWLSNLDLVTYDEFLLACRGYIPQNTPLLPSAKPSVTVMPLETLIYCKLSYSTETGRGTLVEYR